jgi:hypothetical protein
MNKKLKVVKYFIDVYQPENTISVEVSNEKRKATMVLQEPFPDMQEFEDELNSLDSEISMTIDNQPLLNVTDVKAIENPDCPVTLDFIANNQAIRFPKDHPLHGQLVLDINGKVQYYRNSVHYGESQDEDLRQASKEHTYMSPEIEAEVNGKVLVIIDQALKTL